MGQSISNGNTNAGRLDRPLPQPDHVLDPLFSGNVGINASPTNGFTALIQERLAGRFSKNLMTIPMPVMVDQLSKRTHLPGHWRGRCPQQSLVFSRHQVLIVTA